MPQEFIIVKCFSCGNFQVHLIRKDRKFICKVCGVKQSVKKVYGQGSSKDCRLAVQKLNTEVNTILNIDEDRHTNEERDEKENRGSVWDIGVKRLKVSKWESFLEEDGLLKNSYEEEHKFPSTVIPSFGHRFSSAANSSNVRKNEGETGLCRTWNEENEAKATSHNLSDERLKHIRNRTKETAITNSDNEKESGLLQRRNDEKNEAVAKSHNLGDERQELIRNQIKETAYRKFADLDDSYLNCINDF